MATKLPNAISYIFIIANVTYGLRGVSLPLTPIRWNSEKYNLYIEAMIKRPKRNDTEDDILEQQRLFMQEKTKNPALQPAATVVKSATNVSESKQSLFKRSRAQPKPEELPSRTTIVLGEVVERTCYAPSISDTPILNPTHAFPPIPKIPIPQTNATKSGKSLFALAMENLDSSGEPMDTDTPATVQRDDLQQMYGQTSRIVKHTDLASELHNKNLQLLSTMNEKDILAERNKLLHSMDPALIAMLKRQHEQGKPSMPTNPEPMKVQSSSSKPMVSSSVFPLTDTPAKKLLDQSNHENWMHFDVVEQDKLEWMRDITDEAKELKDGEKFEARFDWKGILLPYNFVEQPHNGPEKDERELYLHGDEPQRPGYTLQELFRLARSNVAQQRISAFGAIGGILNLYNQGFYDSVLELPVTKIFFLLRFGLDDNTPAMLEVVSKGLAYLLYNDADETLLDFIHETPDSYWQPVLQVQQSASDCDDPTSIEALQKQLRELQLRATAAAPQQQRDSSSMRANVVESEEESKTSMNDFQLAESDLIECLLRSNILQRITFILERICPESSTVSSCLKLLIRIARSSRAAALRIATDDQLLSCIFEYFLPDLCHVDTSNTDVLFYNFPQSLALKLLRVLIGQGSNLALRLIASKWQLIEKLQNYLFSCEDLKSPLVKVQIESLRIVRCLTLLDVEPELHRKFLPAFRYMLDWHYNHTVYEVGGPYLLRQHAAALLASISSVAARADIYPLLGAVLQDCCCKWFCMAANHGITEFSQTTLLTACIDVVVSISRNTERGIPFDSFIRTYLPDCLKSNCFVNCFNSILTSSIVLKNGHDRRNVHAALPNAGSVLMHNNGPHLIVSQTYPVHLLSAVWSLVEQRLSVHDATLLNALNKSQNIQYKINEYLSALLTIENRLMATNFFAAAEINFIHKLICFENRAETQPSSSQMLRIVYNFICCLTSRHTLKIEELFNSVIFNSKYMACDARSLSKWKSIYMDFVHYDRQFLFDDQKRLSFPSNAAPVLPLDWPYFLLKILLENYLQNAKMSTETQLTEREILLMTFSLVEELERHQLNYEIVEPTEKLMYLMIAFMGQESLFLDPQIHEFLRTQILRFYDQCRHHTFQFDAQYQDKCKFENLYALFVDHFQAVSYGDELFGSLLLIPLAQKYDGKWRKRVWSEYSAALRYLDCPEDLLLDGLDGYLKPCETDVSLIRAYNTALMTNLVRPNSIPYKIATHHVNQFRQLEQENGGAHASNSS